MLHDATKRLHCRLVLSQPNQSQALIERRATPADGIGASFR